MESIVVDSLSFGYTERQVIKHIDLTIDKGELVVIVGENGSGKSTLLRLLLGELTAQDGTITMLGENIKTITDFSAVGYVPQMNIVNQIPFPITCLELVVMNLYKDFGFFKIPRKRHKQKAREILTSMDLTNYMHTPFNELSGGLQQRVLIARAMINAPEILILDEPTAGVDEESKTQFYKIIEDLNTTHQMTVILVTHEIASAQAQLTIDQMYQLKEGGLTNVRV